MSRIRALKVEKNAPQTCGIIVTSNIGGEIHNYAKQVEECLLRNLKNLADNYQVGVFDVVDSTQLLDCGSEPP